MEGLEHSLPVVDFFNLILGRPLAALLAIFGLQVKDPAHLLPDYLVMTLIVAILLSILLGLAGRRVSLIPGKTQVVLESLIDFFEGMIVDTIGEQGKNICHW